MLMVDLTYNLPLEVVLCIVRLCTTRDVLALRLVNSTWERIATERLYKSVKLRTRGALVSFIKRFFLNLIVVAVVFRLL